MDIVSIKIEEISPNPYQPRKRFDEKKLQELANSLKEYGMLQPIIVIKLKNGLYELIAGERRLEAAKKIGLSEISAVIRDSSAQEKLELALIENIHRHNLNAIERAYAFKKMIAEFGLTQQKIATKIGKSREAVANTLRILDLPAEAQRALLNGKITEGHGRAILILANKEKQILLYKKILRDKLSVRQAEELAKKINLSTADLPQGDKKEPSLTRSVKNLENKLSDVLNAKIKIVKKGEKGKIIIEFFSEDELENIISNLTEN